MVSIQSIITSSSWTEGGPLVVLEALSAGTPVLGSNALGNTNRFIIDGINGFVVPHSDVKALHAKMKEILTWKEHERSRRHIIIREFRKIPGFENQLRIFHNAVEHEILKMSMESSVTAPKYTIIPCEYVILKGWTQKNCVLHTRESSHRARSYKFGSVRYPTLSPSN